MSRKCVIPPLMLLTIGCLNSGCGSFEPADFSAAREGGLKIAIDLDGTDSTDTFETVAWEIHTAKGVLVDSGVINVSQPGSTASFEKFGLVPGNYTVILTASSVDGDTNCSGSAPFIIKAVRRTQVSVLLNCQTRGRVGGVRVNGELNRCAELTMIVVSPLQVAVGFTIDLMATADDAEGDPIQFEWSASSGTFFDPTSGATVYTCEEVGAHDVTLRVSDDVFAFCVDEWTAPVECVAAPLCGNGVINPPEEECDPPDVPAGWVCDPAACLRIPSCGDSIVDSGEDCDPPDDVFCDRACLLIDPCDPNPCDDTNSCTQDLCSADPGDNSVICDFSDELDGAACNDFSPSTGVCLGGVCQAVPDGVTQVVPVVCSNNVTADVLEIPYELTVTPLGPVVDGVPVDVSLTGVAQFPPVFLNAAIATIPGLTEVTLNGLTATPYIRSGTVSAPGDLTTLTSSSSLPLQVPIPITTDPAICGPLDLATCPNTCADGSSCIQGNGGLACLSLGDQSCLPRSACTCVVDPLVLPLSANIVTITPSGAGGEILIGWNEDTLPPVQVIVTSPPGPNGIRVLAVVLQIGQECYMGKLDSAGFGDAAALENAELLSVPISP